MAAVGEVCSQAELQAFCAERSGVSTLLFWAPWHPPSLHLTKVLGAIAAEHKTVGFAKCNTDVCPQLAADLGADQVPFAVFLSPQGKKVEQLAGADPPKLVAKVKALAGRSFESGAAVSAETEDLNKRLKQLINFSPVMLFMKGSKEEPHCKFSKQAVAMLNKHEAEYSTFNILEDEEVRQGLKDYSNWKTYPQFYVNGELVGGVDILKEMDEDGSLKELLEKCGEGEKELPLEERLKKLINLKPVTLFMKGEPEQPRCGFSGKIVALLKEKNVDFAHFDILSDEDVRQGLKAYSNWPTYPQLYAQGKLVGGLDIVRELAEEGSLLSELGLEK